MLLVLAAERPNVYSCRRKNLFQLRRSEHFSARWNIALLRSFKIHLRREVYKHFVPRTVNKRGIILLRHHLIMQVTAVDGGASYTSWKQIHND
jgi:hypothetical protein